MDSSGYSLAPPGRSFDRVLVLGVRDLDRLPLVDPIWSVVCLDRLFAPFRYLSLHDPLHDPPAFTVSRVSTFVLKSTLKIRLNGRFELAGKSLHTYQT